jgi:hypothetical protein
MLVLHQGLEAGDSVKRSRSSSSARMALSSSVRPGGGIGCNLAAHATGRDAVNFSVNFSVNFL